MLRRVSIINAHFRLQLGVVGFNCGLCVHVVRENVVRFVESGHN